MHTAVFPGSFDPVTLGHVDIINRALPMFDRLILAIGENSAKKSLFPLEKRMEWLQDIYRSEDNVEVRSYSGLTIDFSRQCGASFLVRGLRSTLDFEYEKTIAQLNHSLEDGIDTIFLVCEPEYSHISSTIVREILINRGDASPFLHGKVAAKIMEALDRQQ